jgi:asparagine synthase (glutamine-hydrolysing)
MFEFLAAIGPIPLNASELIADVSLKADGCFFQMALLKSNHRAIARKLNFNGGVDVSLLGFNYNDPNAWKSIEDLEQGLDGPVCAFVSQEAEVVVYADPCGWRSIYYVRHRGRLWLSSNIRHFRRLPGFQLVPDTSKSLAYACMSFIPGEETIWRGVYALPMGCKCVVDTSLRAKIRTYYAVEPSIQQQRDEVRAARQLYDLTLSNTDRIRQATGQRDCVVLLSGGLDSTVALYAAIEVFGKHHVQAISVNFGKNLPSENQFIDLAIEAFQCPHTYIEVSPASFLSDMNDIYTWIDDPIGDPVVMPNYIMNKVIPREQTLVLTGEGGDPCFGGPKNQFMTGMAWASNLYDDGDSPSFLAKAYLESFKRGYDDCRSMLNLGDELFRNAYQSLLDLLCHHLKLNETQSFLNRLLFANKRLKCHSLILPKVQKTTQPFGRLSLSPIYTRSILDFCRNTSIEVKYPRLREKYILKQAFKHVLPDAIVHRPKSGMRVPLSFWREKDILGYHRQVLVKENKETTYRFFNPKYIKRLLGKDAIARKGLKTWMISVFIQTVVNLQKHEQ